MSKQFCIIVVHFFLTLLFFNVRNPVSRCSSFSNCLWHMLLRYDTIKTGFISKSVNKPLQANIFLNFLHAHYRQHGFQLPLFCRFYCIRFHRYIVTTQFLLHSYFLAETKKRTLDILFKTEIQNFHYKFFILLTLTMKGLVCLIFNRFKL